MKSNNYFLILVVFATTTLASCEMVGGIFKAGMWTTLILIVLVVALIFWLLRRFRR